jgi:N-acetylmuramic acid 6-phosphate etherase
VARRDEPAGSPDSSITEQVNPRTTDLDRLPTGVILDRILAEDALVTAAVQSVHAELERAVDVLHDTLAGRGRWFNVGAGSSGRIGMLDAAEIPPTFGLEPNRIQAILAGAPDALVGAVEGAEDDTEAARAALVDQGVGQGDAVVALSASGRTPFTLAAVEHARDRGARTIGITCNPGSPLARSVELPLVVVVGPEAITGSTRMKGGLAQKIVLHALSTTVMVRLGRVRGNLMTEVRAVSSKLRSRGASIVARLAEVSGEEAARALDEAAGSVEGALDRLGVPRRGYASTPRGD